MIRSYGIPVLMITYNRLEYTKRAYKALSECYGATPFVIDNASTDGTREWLRENVPQFWSMSENKGISGAMNFFLDHTRNEYFVAKVDNDTIIPPDFLESMMVHMTKADIVQAKHPILKATHPGGFDDWVKNMPSDGALRFNHFVGGSGILFHRQLVDRIPDTDWKLGGWRKWQGMHPKVKKAFATDVEVQLLDTNEDGADYSQYPEYYRETKRLC